MKVTLDKQIQLHSAIVYLRFEKDIERKDIQEYLNGKHFDDPLIENRIKEYLKNIKVYDEKYQLTSLGNAVKESGMLPTVEEGMYQIWFTNIDSYFGNKIIYFKRVQPSKESNDEKLNLQFDSEGHFCLPTENNPFSNLKLLPVVDYFGQNRNHTDVIALQWNWDNLEKSNYIFCGQLVKGENQIKFKAIPIPCQEDLKSRIEELLPDWDKRNERLKVTFNEISDQCKLSFENNFQTKWRDFQVQLQKVPLMPYNLEDAKKWRNWLITEALRKEYLNPADFESLVIETNEKDAFKPYLNSLDILNPELFSSSIKKDIHAFWHLNAPLDLNPNAKTKLSAKPIELKKDDKISFKSIVNKLGFDHIDSNSVCIYNTYFLALSKTPIGLDGVFTEADYRGYARVPIANNKTSFSDYNSTNNTVSNRTAIFFPICTCGSLTVVAVALMDSANGGNVILRGTVQLVKTYEFGDIIVYEKGMLTFSFE